MKRPNTTVLLFVFFIISIFSCVGERVNSVREQTRPLAPLPSEWFNVIKLPLGATPLPKKNPKDLMKLQKQLWAKKVPLNPGTFNQVPVDFEDGNKLNTEEWDKFISQLSKNQANTISEMMNARDFIKYKDLDLALATVIGKFSELVRGDYSIGLNLRKSSHWIASLVIPHLPTMPVSAFEPNVDTIFNSSIEHEYLKPVQDDQSSHFVLFDDASYTGAQISGIIHRILNNKQNVRITIFVPFSSDIAIKTYSNSFNMELAKEKKNIITIVTTDRMLKPLTSVIQTHEKFLETRIFTTVDYRKMMLTHTAWKTPDGVSFPDVLVAASINKESEFLTLTGFNVLTGYKGDIKLIPNNAGENNKKPVFCLLPQKIAPYKKYERYDWDTAPVID